MAAEPFIFVGFELEEKIQACLDSCKDSDKLYFQDPKYLEVVELDSGRYIGKKIGMGVAQDRLEDAARSVVSLLARICVDLQLDSSGVSLVAYEEAPTVDQVI